MTTRLYHPHLAEAFEDVPDKNVKDWTDAGWRKTPLDKDSVPPAVDGPPPPKA